jgi:hypothetical protein
LNVSFIKFSAGRILSLISAASANISGTAILKSINSSGCRKAKGSPNFCSACLLYAMISEISWVNPLIIPPSSMLILSKLFPYSSFLHVSL